jgi:tetratricopeptide (TPR) repeat protein
VWEVGTWRECRDFGRAQCAFSPDSRLLALNDVHATIRFVVVDTGDEVARLTFPEPNRYRPLCFTPDGAQLIAADSDRKALYAWNLRDIRRGLSALGLDWDWPEFPPAAPSAKTPEPLTVEVITGDLGQTALTRESRARQAIERYRRALVADPNDVLACNNLAWTYLAAPAELRDVSAALPLAEKAVRLAPDNAIYRNTLGLAFYRTGRYREAVDTLRPNLAAQEDRGLALDLYVLAMSHYRLGESVLAKDNFDLALRWARAQRGLSSGQLDELAAFHAEAKELLGAESKND